MIELREVDRHERTEDLVAVLTVPLADVKRLHSAVALAAGSWAGDRREAIYRSMAEDLQHVFDDLNGDLLLGMVLASQDA